MYEGSDDEEIKNLKAKEGETLFKKMWFEEKTNTSLLECHLKTGRTH